MASRRLLTLHSRLSLVRLPAIRHYSSGFQPGPSPPRLPPEQQAEFERLQRAVAERFVETPAVETPASSPSPASTSRHVSSPTSDAGSATATAAATQNKDEEELSAGVWRGAKPEFKGDVNPKTGEVGGPKNEPLRWGSAGDWSYNGRVTDF